MDDGDGNGNGGSLASTSVADNEGENQPLMEEEDHGIWHDALVYL